MLGLCGGIRERIGKRTGDAVFVTVLKPEQKAESRKQKTGTEGRLNRNRQEGGYGRETSGSF